MVLRHDRNDILTGVVKKFAKDFKFQVLTSLRHSLLAAGLLFLGCPSVASATFPPEPTRLAGFTGNMALVHDDHQHAMVYYNLFGNPEIAVNYFSNNVWYYIPPGAFSFDFSLQMDPAGNAMLLAIDDSSGDLNAFYFNQQMWIETPTPLDVSVLSQSLSLNKAGQAMALWSTLPDTGARVSLFSNGSWGPAETLGPESSSSIAVAYSVNGTAAAAWSDASNNMLVSNYIGGVWSAPLTLQPNASVRSLVINDSGIATLAMQDNTTNDIYASNYIGGAWQSPTLIAPSAFVRTVKIGDNGKAVILLQDVATQDVSASNYDGTAWTVPTLLSPPDPFGPATIHVNLEMAPNGTAVATWQYQQTFFMQYDLYYAQFDGTTWAPTVDFQTGIAGVGPAVSVQSNGDALLFWANGLDFPNPGQLLSARLPLGGTLTDQQVVRVSPFSDTRNPNVFLADNGFTVFAWTESEPSFDAFIPYGLASVVPGAPSAGSGTSCKDRFASQTDRVNTITWLPSTDPNVVAYKISRNGVFIASVPANGSLKYRDHNRCKDTDVYSVVSVDADGIFSSPITIRIK